MPSEVGFLVLDKSHGTGGRQARESQEDAEAWSSATSRRQPVSLCPSDSNARRKIRYPKGFDPENPGPPPDPERPGDDGEVSTVACPHFVNPGGFQSGSDQNSSGAVVFIALLTVACCQVLTCPA